MSTSSEPTPTAERQVLVVGGGVDGLATAAFLRQEGLAPIVVTASDDGTSTHDAEPSTQDTGTSTHDPAARSPHECDPDTHPVLLWRPALALLAELGIADALRSSGDPIRQWRLHHGLSRTSERLASTGDGDSVVAVDRATLEKRLRESLSPAHVRLSKTPRRLASTDHGLRVDFADGVRERFDAVVGADGVRSWVRIGRAETPTPWGTTEWPVSLDAPDAAGTVVDAWGPDAMVTLFPDGRGLLVTPTTDRGEPVRARTATSRLASLVDRVDAVDGSTATVGAPTDHRGRPSDRWAAGRVGFVGAAARSLPPTLSLGPSLVIEAAAVLARELATSVPVAEALGHYARRRRDRLRTLDRQVSIRFQPSNDETDPIGAAHALRTAVLRSFFAGRSATLSTPVTDSR